MTLALQHKSARRKASLALIGVAAISGALMAAIGMTDGQHASAAGISGAIYTTLSDGSSVNANLYDHKSDVYLNGGPTNAPQCTNPGLDTGIYYYQVTSPDGVVLSSDALQFRQIQVDAEGNVDGNGPTGNHAEATAESPCGSLGVQLMPYDDTPNSGGEYSVNIYPQACVEEALAGDPSALTRTTPRVDLATLGCATKNDNFKVGDSITATPTNTPVTPTNTPVTPTNTPVTPTNTPVTPTNTPVTPTNTPVTPTSTPVTPTATPTGTLTPTATPTNTSTPTATPTGTLTPTETPTNPPTNTPTNTPTQPSTVSPEQPTAVPTTPVSEVLGEKTPGAPSAGTGVVGESGGINMLLVVLGLIAISAGLGAVTLATTGRDDD